MADKMSARPAPIRKSRSFRSFPNLLQPIADKKMSSLRATDRILIARVPKDAQVEPRKQTTPGGPNEPSQPRPDRQRGKIVQTQQQSPRAPPPKEEDVSLRYKHLGLTDVVADVDNGDARDNTLSKQARRLSTFLYDEDGIAVPRDLVHTKEDSIKRKKGKSNIVYYEDSTQITVDNDALANDFANQHERQTTLRKESDEHFEVHVTEETLVNGQVDENIIVVDFPNDVPIYSATFPPGVQPKDSVNSGRNDTEKTYYPLVPASERNDKKDRKGREPELVEWPFNVDLYDYDDVVYMGHVHEDDVGYGSLDRNITDIRSETVSPRKGFSQDDKLSVRATGRIQSADRSVDYGSYFLEPITHDRYGYGAHGAETTKYHQVARWAKHVQSYHNSLSHPSQNIDAFGSATTGLFRFSETNLVEVEYNESVYDESEGEDVKSIPPVVPIFHDEESTRFAEEEATAVDRRPSRQIVYDENGHGAHLIAQTTSVTQASVAVRNVMQGPVASNSLPRSTTEYSAKADFLPPKANSATKFANVKHISTDSSASDLCYDCIDVKQAAVTLEQMLQRRLSSGQSNVERDGVRPSREPTRAEQPPRDVEPKPKTTRPSYVVVAQTKETSAVANETPSMASEKNISRPRMNFTTKKKELNSSLGRSAHLHCTENVSKGVQIGALTPNQNETKSESKVFEHYLPNSKQIETEIAMQPTTPTKPARVESFTIRSGLETGEDDSMSSRSVNNMIQRFESMKRSGRTKDATDHCADGQGRDDSVVPSVFI